MNAFKLIFAACCMAATAVQAVGTDRQLLPVFNARTGALTSLTISGDETNMNWLTATDGTQYPWITDGLGWGLGYLTEVKGHETIKHTWKHPVSMSADGMHVEYKAGDIYIKVDRKMEKGELLEQYTFTNTGKVAVDVYDAGIYTPFNDNYPDAKTCTAKRTDVHIWDGGSGAYVNALRMGGTSPHIGLVFTQGAMKSYEVWERGRNKANSQTRGIFALNLPNMRLRSGESYSVAWSLFPHKGNEDFEKKLLQHGGVLVECNKYIFEKGETATATLRSIHPLKNCRAFLNGVPVATSFSNGVYTATVPVTQAGEMTFTFKYDNGKCTYARCMAFNNIGKLLEQRVNFIRTRQQMNNAADPRYGAYMVYDNEGDSIYPNNTPNCNPVDRDEGAERTGMAVLLAKWYLLKKDPEVKTSLLKYARFLRDKLQTKDFKTFSSVDKTGRNRGYNYMWAADFYFLMYQITGEKQYAEYGYNTLKSMFAQFGYGFYAIDIPVCRGLECLKKAGMTKEHRRLLADFEKTGEIFIKNGTNYPKHEVNYEQSIVAPAIQFLLEMYLETKQEKYLAEAKRQLPCMEAFVGRQPSYHLNGISIRHWDDYWFGKRELFGDTFPHYWSTITGGVYHLLAKATGEKNYQSMAENIVRNNLCLFSEDGKASCAYVYPYRVDGEKGAFYDPYANDQDWALVYYLLVNNDL